MASDARKILLVEDEKAIRDAVAAYLEREGYWVVGVGDGQSAVEEFEKHQFDLIVLDLMLPKLSGERVCRAIRDTSDVPIIMLTAKGEVEDRISGLESGADDYLTKPFEPRELLLRIAAILRRVPAVEAAQPKILTLGLLRYDMEKGELWQDDSYIRLTGTEQALLRRLAASRGQPVSRADLIEDLGRGGGTGDEVENSERAIDVQITRLRRKIESDPKEPRFLQTVRGTGYMLMTD